ncbi:MAG: hypothetical protein VB096_05905 [Pseudoflavonifractor sp.]|nr:hypothetical protein [Pseudoflavonifractor sp.]
MLIAISSWVPIQACSHEFSTDVTEQMERWERFFGRTDAGSRSYYLQIFHNGSVQLCEDDDGGNSVVLDLPDFNYCPICGEKYRKDDEHDR